MKFTEELLLDAVANSTSIAGVMRYLNLVPAGGTHAHLSRRIENLRILCPNCRTQTASRAGRNRFGSGSSGASGADAVA